MCLSPSPSQPPDHDGGYDHGQRPGGSRLILGGDDFVVVREIGDWARGLRYGDTVVEADPVSALPAADPPSALPQRSALERLRELAELRDAGLITPEEHEENKRRLLEGL